MEPPNDPRDPRLNGLDVVAFCFALGMLAVKSAVVPLGLQHGWFSRVASKWISLALFVITVHFIALFAWARITRRRQEAEYHRQLEQWLMEVDDEVLARLPSGLPSSRGTDRLVGEERKRREQERGGSESAAAEGQSRTAMPTTPTSSAE